MKSVVAIGLLVFVALSAMAQADWELAVSSSSFDGGGPIKFWRDSPHEVVFGWIDGMTYEYLLLYSPDTFTTIDTVLLRAPAFDIHPSDTRTMLALNSESALLKTTDLGATWETLLDNCYGNFDYCDTDPDYIWALPQDDFSGYNMAYSSDGGDTWNNAAGDYTEYASNIYALNSDGMHALLDDGVSIYRTTNGGINWVETLAGTVGGESFWTLSVSNADPNRIAVAYDYTVFVSEDAGSTWTSCTTFVEYNWGLMCDPFDPEMIILSNDEGVFRSTDFGETWEYWASSTLLDYVEQFAITVIGGERRYYASTSSGIYKRSGDAVSGGPRLSYRFPGNGQWVSEDTLIMLAFNDAEGINPSTAIIDVDGTSYTVADPELSAVADTLVFTPPSSWVDGDITVTLVGIEDTGGEASPDSGSSFTFHVDKTPPEILFYEPDSGAVLPAVPSGIMIVFHDDGCGNTDETWDFTDGDITLGSWSTGVMMEGADTILIDFGASGIDIDMGDTVSFLFRGWDNPDIGEPNMVELSWWFVVGTSILEDKLPESPMLSVYPNPFNRACMIDAPTNASITVFNSRGQEVERLPLGAKAWQPSNNVPSGVYSIRINTGTEIKTIEAIYLK